MQTIRRSKREGEITFREAMMAMAFMGIILLSTLVII